MGCSENISFLFQNPNFKSLIYCVWVVFSWEHKGWKTKPPKVLAAPSRWLAMLVVCTVGLRCTADCNTRIAVTHGQFLLFTSSLLLLAPIRPRRHQQLWRSPFTSPPMKPHTYLLPQQVPHSWPLVPSGPSCVPAHAHVCKSRHTRAIFIANKPLLTAGLRLGPLCLPRVCCCKVIMFPDLRA